MENENKDTSPQRHECTDTARYDNHEDAVAARDWIREERSDEEKVAKVVRRGKKCRPAEYYQLRVYKKIEKPAGKKSKGKDKKTQ